MKKEIQGSHYFSFFALSNLLIQTCLHFRIDMAAHLFWTCKMHIAYVVYYCICLPLCAHILSFDAAKFLKQFSFIYLTVSVVRQRNEYEKVIETRPIKTT